MHSFNNHLLNETLCWPQGLPFPPRSFSGRMGWEVGLLGVQLCRAWVGDFPRGFQSGGDPDWKEPLVLSVVMAAALAFVRGGFQYVPAVGSVWHFILASYS